jgi:hypothetical protein
MTTLVLQLPDDLASMVEQAAGEQDVGDYVKNVLRLATRRKLARLTAPADELTPADHIRMATEAESDSLPIEEFRKLVMAQIATDAETEMRAVQ